MAPAIDLNAPFIDHTEALERAEQGVSALECTRRDRWYPLYHIASAGGWINDPNGLSYFQGRWHVFFQLHPFGTQWGPMHWGHVSSADLVTWRREPVALAPSIEAENAGVFSGSAVVDANDTLNLLYTGHRWHNGRDDSAGNREVQCLATSRDGVRFEKHGVVIDNPEDLIDFRDPKVWRQDGRWYLVLGQRSRENRGEIVLFTSNDLVNWRREGILYRHPDPNVYMLECPDFFPLTAPDGKTRWVLCFSAMGAKAQGYMNRNRNNAGYVVGTWEPGRTFEPEGAFHLWDWGQNFYAPQSMAAPDGRRLMIGWMSPAGAAPMQDDGWCGQLTLPREVSLAADGALITTPARELEALREDTVEVGPVTLGANEDLTVIEDAEATEIELTIDLAASTAERAGLKVHATEDGGYVYVAYDDQTGRVVLDRGAVRLGERGYRAAPREGHDSNLDTLKLRIYIDRGSIEVYVDGGRAAMSAYSFPTPGPRAVNLCAEGGSLAVSSLRRHRLRSIGLA